MTRLAVLAPDPARAERVQARCHAALAPRRGRAARLARFAAVAWHLLGPVLLGVVSLVFLAALATTTMRVAGVLYE